MRTGEEVWVRRCLGKKRYSSLQFVEKMIQKIKNERGTDLYNYYCGSCQGFHLTKLKKVPEVANV